MKKGIILAMSFALGITFWLMAIMHLDVNLERAYIIGKAGDFFVCIGFGIMWYISNFEKEKDD